MATVSKTKVRGETRWVVSHRPAGGKRTRQFFTTAKAAEAARVELELQRRTSGDVWAALTAAERTEAAGIMGEIHRAGTTLRAVWEAWKAEAGSRVMESVTLRKVTEECVTSKRMGGRKERYLKELSYCLRRFISGREAMPVSSVTIGDVEAWLLGVCGPSQWARSTWVNRISTLFSFAVRRGYCRQNPCDRLEPVHIVRTPPVILTVDQCSTLLNKLRINHQIALPWFVLGLFAGVRPEEADKVRWDDIDLDRGILVIDAAASKTSDRRVVHLTEPALAWLKVAKLLSPSIPVASVTRRRAQRALRRDLGADRWPQDVLRHSCASYMVAHWGDSKRVTEELGHSIRVLLNHYREIVPKEEAAKFFALTPRISSTPDPSQCSRGSRPSTKA